MKVRGKVKLMCEFCRRAVVKLSRDQHYVYIYCTKNPRHKQRTKFASMATHAEAHCCPTSDHAHAAGQDAVSEGAGVPCLPEPPFAYMQQHMLSNLNRGLLGSRHTSVLGELYWRAAMQER